MPSSSGRFPFSKMKRTILLSLGLPAALHADIFVSKDSPLHGDGSTWGAPLPTLQAALQDIEKGETVHVAQGVYYPTDAPSPPGAGESATFLLGGEITIIGGYAPGGRARDPLIYKTILSGNIFGDVPETDEGLTKDFIVSTSTPYHLRKSEHVITIADPAGATVLDGLWITDGHSHSDETGGAGIWAQPGANLTLTDCHFRHHAAEGFGRGAAVFFDDFDTGERRTLTVADCTFVDCGTPFGLNGGNHIGSQGSACYVRNGSLAITGSLFAGNHATHGGAIYISAPPLETGKWSEVSISNSRFKGNRSKWGGGAISCGSRAQVSVEDCLFSGNHAGSPGFPGTHGGAIRFSPSHQGGIDLTNNTFGWNTAGGSVFEHVAHGGAVSLEGGGVVTATNNIFQGNHGANVINGATSSSIDNVSGYTIRFYSNYNDVQEITSTIVDTDPTRPNYFIEDFEIEFAEPIVLQLEDTGGDNVRYPPDRGGDLRPLWGQPSADLGGANFTPGRVDADGGSRRVGLAVDLGCFETTPPPGTLEILRVRRSQAASSIIYIDYIADRPVAVWRSSDLKTWVPDPRVPVQDESPINIFFESSFEPRLFYQLRYAPAP